MNGLLVHAAQFILNRRESILSLKLTTNQSIFSDIQYELLQSNKKPYPIKMRGGGGGGESDGIGATLSCTKVLLARFSVDRKLMNMISHL